MRTNLLPRFLCLAAWAALAFANAVSAQSTTPLLNYQGRVVVGGVNFSGTGAFQFALVDATGATTYWSDDGTSTAGSEPFAGVPLTVTNGLYSVLLGDATVQLTTPGQYMQAIPASVFANTDVRLRIWFNDGTHGWAQLSPDQRISASAYAVTAGTALAVSAGGVTSSMIASQAVTSAQLAANAVQTSNIAAAAVGNTQLANSSLTVAAGSGLAGGGLVALGGSTTLTNAGVTSITLSPAAGSGLSLSGATGAIVLSNNATTANTAGAIVLRDPNGNFDAGTVSALNLSCGGTLTLPATASQTSGVIILGSPFLHGYGQRNAFGGAGAGNFIMTGTDNAAQGYLGLQNNTTGSYNAALGSLSLSTNTTGLDNTAAGYAALASNRGGKDNTAAGFLALNQNQSGVDNTAGGSQAMYSNVQGNRNTANGFASLYNDIGSDNTALGYQAMYGAKNAPGSENTAVGSNSLSSNNQGSGNTAIGYNALNVNTEGFNNAALGFNALIANTTGNQNTALGYAALSSDTTGSNNVAIGPKAGANVTTGNNNIYLNHPGANESNAIRIGQAGLQNAAYIAGIAGATSSGGVAVYVAPNGQLGTLTSSRRFKDDIEPMDRGSEALLSLQPVRFRYKPEIDPKGLPQFGLVAEDVEKIDPDLVVRDLQGEIYSVRYEAVNAMLLNEFLKEHRRVEEEARTIELQQKKIEAMESRLEEMDSLLRRVNERLERQSPASVGPK